MAKEHYVITVETYNGRKETSIVTWCPPDNLKDYPRPAIPLHLIPFHVIPLDARSVTVTSARMVHDLDAGGD